MIAAAVVGAAINAGPTTAEVEVAHGVPCDQQQRIGVLRNIVAPGAISRWVQSCASSDGWQQLDRLLVLVSHTSLYALSFKV